ncbi:hypothetical protein [Pseudogemmobacter hezensis]|uniref:hypothetical protein n=1 Tax=Pseudogemmobacter hezensis TaxID=2737662 RepID=UPI00155294C6|nr:hypothetical protein [Pseudogemmobacter hezensis]
MLSLMTAMLLGLSSTPALTEEEWFFLLSGQSLTCLRDHAGDYAPKPGETLFIRVSDCGTANMKGQDFADMVVNSAPDIEVAEADSPDAVVAFLASDFECLASLPLPEDDTLVAYYPERCAVEARD